MITIHKVGDTWYTHQNLTGLQRLCGQETNLEAFIDPNLPADKILEIIRHRHPGTLIELRNWPSDNYK